MLELIIELSLCSKEYRLIYKESYTIACWLNKFDGQFQEEICSSKTLCIGIVGLRTVSLLAILVKSVCGVHILTHNMRALVKCNEGACCNEDNILLFSSMLIQWPSI